MERKVVYRFAEFRKKTDKDWMRDKVEDIINKLDEICSMCGGLPLGAEHKGPHNEVVCRNCGMRVVFQSKTVIFSQSRWLVMGCFVEHVVDAKLGLIRTSVSYANGNCCMMLYGMLKRHYDGGVMDRIMSIEKVVAGRAETVSLPSAEGA